MNSKSFERVLNERQGQGFCEPLWFNREFQIESSRLEWCMRKIGIAEDILNLGFEAMEPLHSFVKLTFEYRKIIFVIINLSSWNQCLRTQIRNGKRKTEQKN